MNPEYFAGFFDGEGCIHVSKQHQLLAVTTQKQRHVLDLASQKWGGRLYYVGANRNSWQWRLSGNEAQGFLMEILPYLIVKQDVAALAIQFQKLKRKGVKTTPEIVSLEEDFKQKISRLNRKD